MTNLSPDVRAQVRASLAALDKSLKDIQIKLRARLAASSGD